MDFLKRYPPAKLLRSPLADVKSFDGVKFVAQDGSWLMLRGSGTEPILRIYAEAKSDADVQQVAQVRAQIDAASVASSAQGVGHNWARLVCGTISGARASLRASLFTPGAAFFGQRWRAFFSRNAFSLVGSVAGDPSGRVTVGTGKTRCTAVRRNSGRGSPCSPGGIRIFALRHGQPV